MTYIAVNDSSDGVSRSFTWTYGTSTQTASMRQSAGGGPEAFIIYDESSSPSADDYLIEVNYPMETYI